MFTGLVLGMGEVIRVSKTGSEARLTIKPLFPVTQWIQGESIAVNGVCLSVEKFDSLSFTAYASTETMQVTNLHLLTSGSRVNIERALALGDRLGGHLVSGHVDAVAKIVSIEQVGSSLCVSVAFPEQFSSQVIPKGSITLDGVSLTINTCSKGILEVNIIPETQQTTTIKSWRPGDIINFETDLIGKYIQNMLGAYLTPSQQEAPGITTDFLRQHGF